MGNFATYAASRQSPVSAMQHFNYKMFVMSLQLSFYTKLSDLSTP